MRIDLQFFGGRGAGSSGGGSVAGTRVSGGIVLKDRYGNDPKLDAAINRQEMDQRPDSVIDKNNDGRKYLESLPVGTKITITNYTGDNTYQKQHFEVKNKNGKVIDSGDSWNLVKGKSDFTRMGDNALIDGILRSKKPYKLKK